MKKKICSFIVLCFILASALFPAGSANTKSGYAKIPFTFDFSSYMPGFLLEDCEGGEPLKIIFDSGYNHEVFYRSAIKKAGKEAEDMLVGMIAQQYMTLSPGISQKKLAGKIQEFLEQGDPDITVGLTCTDSFVRKNLYIDSHPFLFDPAPAARQKEDGIVGLKFFGACDQLTIDYVNNVIVINGKPLSGVEGPLVKVPMLELYKTEIEVDGIRQDAIIDTGAQVFVLCDESAMTMTDEEKLDFIMNGKIQTSSPACKEVTVSFGSISRKLEACRSSDRNAKANENGRRGGYVYNLLGYSFFEGHRIQFDFKHGKFIME